MAAKTRFYIHYSDFGGALTFNFMGSGQPHSETMFYWIAQPPTEPFRKLNPGKHVLYVELPVSEDSTEDEGEFTALAFVHHHASRRKRLDLFLSPSDKPRHIHARLTANETETLFDNDVPLADDNEAKPPLILDEPNVA